jgi:hypothetical protein
VGCTEGAVVPHLLSSSFASLLGVSDEYPADTPPDDHLSENSADMSGKGMEKWETDMSIDCGSEKAGAIISLYDQLKVFGLYDNCGLE